MLQKLFSSICFHPIFSLTYFAKYHYPFTEYVHCCCCAPFLSCDTTNTSCMNSDLTILIHVPWPHTRYVANLKPYMKAAQVFFLYIKKKDQIFVHTVVKKKKICVVLKSKSDFCHFNLVI